MRHGLRIFVIWLIASVIVEVLIGFAPIPSPTLSPEAAGEHQTLYMLFYVGGPIFVFVWVLFLYNLIVFRHRPGQDQEPLAPPDSTPILLLWAGLSFVIVLFMAGWGTFTLHEITEAPGVPVVHAQTTTHGKKQVATTAAPVRPLEVQVIGQQWLWTFRYPSYGGMETRDLYLPIDTPIHFNITSLDVVHSFWIYDFDVKEDAVPGVSNTAWMLAKQLRTFSESGRDWVKCNELCGIWHGYMRAGLTVMSKAAFASWANRQLKFEQSTGLLQYLPKYSLIYYPTSNSNWPTPPQDQSP